MRPEKSPVKLSNDVTVPGENQQVSKLVLPRVNMSSWCSRCHKLQHMLGFFSLIYFLPPPFTVELDRNTSKSSALKSAVQARFWDNRKTCPDKAGFSFRTSLGEHEKKVEHKENMRSGDRRKSFLSCGRYSFCHHSNMYIHYSSLGVILKWSRWGVGLCLSCLCMCASDFTIYENKEKKSASSFEKASRRWVWQAGSCHCQTYKTTLTKRKAAQLRR